MPLEQKFSRSNVEHKQRRSLKIFTRRTGVPTPAAGPHHDDEQDEREKSSNNLKSCQRQRYIGDELRQRRDRNSWIATLSGGGCEFFFANHNPIIYSLNLSGQKALYRCVEVYYYGPDAEWRWVIFLYLYINIYFSNTYRHMYIYINVFYACLCGNVLICIYTNI